MKPTKAFIITCLIILGCVMINIFVQHSFRKKSLDLRHREIKLYVEKIEDFKKELKKGPDESVTKADLAALIEMNYYQSQIDNLYMENEFELSKGYTEIIPVYFFLIMTLWLSFQLDKINKQIQPVSIVKRLDEDTLFAHKAESMKKKLDEQAKGDKST
jgi:hypothetical protein